MKKAKAVPRKPVHRNPKRTGELFEAAFMLKATLMGFLVAKPWGDSELYDFILDNGDRMWRVQLKCTEVVRARGYDVQFIHFVPGKGKVGYGGEMGRQYASIQDR
jgi:PD-(D/E)XK endonuclease